MVGLRPLVLKDKTQVIGKEIAMQPRSRKLIKPRGGSHASFASSTLKGFTVLFLGCARCAGLKPGPQQDRRIASVLTN